MHRTLVLALAIGLAPGWVHAQSRDPDTRAFLSLHGGMQAGDGASTLAGGFTAYDEAAKFTVDQSHEGGGLFSIGGGALVWRNIGVAIAYTRTTDTQTAAATVTVPHPLLFDAPRTASGGIGELSHEEDAVHLQVMALFPISDRFEVQVGAGPTFFTVKHDLVTRVGFTEVGVPYTAIAVGDVAIEHGDENTTGFNVGAEAVFYVTPRLGASAFYRFATATATIDAAGAPVDIDIGGSQFGVGLRVRF